MAGLIKVNGTYKNFGPIYTKVDGGWKKIKSGHIKVDGVWKVWFVDELVDTFDRANASVLGTSTSGNAWLLRRGAWAISSNKAQSTSAKSDYPLASVDLGLTDFVARANEITPGMGIAFNIVDNNNWMAVVPYYNQTSYTYSYCAASEQQAYCIDPVYGQQTYCPAGYQNSQVCTTVSGDCIEYGTKCIESVCYTSWETVCSTCTGTRSVCIKYCNFPKYGQLCCDRDTETYTYQCNCRKVPYEKCDCIDYASYCKKFGPDETVCQSITICPGGEATQQVQIGCNATGYKTVCTQTATGIGYNQYFYVRILAMEGGVARVVRDVQVSERFVSLEVSGSPSGLTIKAFTDNNYTNLLTTITEAPVTLGTSFGIVGSGSAFEEGNTIGAISVKQLG